MKLKNLVKHCRELMHVYVFTLSVEGKPLMSCTSSALLKLAPDSLLASKVIKITEADNDAITVVVGE